MATRTIENKRDRFATILVAPFMTCSARLPIYLLMIAAFIPNKPIIGDFFGLRAAVMLSLYLLGFLAALVTARLLKSSILKAASAPFILELPQYRLPTLRSLGLRLSIAARSSSSRPGPSFSASRSCSGSSAIYPSTRHLPESVDRTRRPVDRTGHPPAGLQLENRHRPAQLDHRARSHRRHPGHALWRRPRHPVAQPAGSTAP